MSKPTPLPELLQKTREKASEKRSEDNENKTERATEYFKRMFDAHNTINYTKEIIDQLYISATYSSPSFDGSTKTQSDPKRFEKSIIKITDLKQKCEDLLIERAYFDEFVFGLSGTERRVLILRCKENKSYKEIAADIDISRSSVERIYRNVCGRACELNLMKD